MISHKEIHDNINKIIKFYGTGFIDATVADVLKRLKDNKQVIDMPLCPGDGTIYRYLITFTDEQMEQLPEHRTPYICGLSPWSRPAVDWSLYRGLNVHDIRHYFIDKTFEQIPHAYTWTKYAFNTLAENLNKEL